MPCPSAGRSRPSLPKSTSTPYTLIADLVFDCIFSVVETEIVCFLSSEPPNSDKLNCPAASLRRSASATQDVSFQTRAMSFLCTSSVDVKNTSSRLPAVAGH